LLQSAKDLKDDRSGLTAAEFANLIFATDEALDVDLRRLKPLTTAAPAYEAEKRGVSVAGDQGIANQWRYYLRKCVKNLSNDLLRGDENKTYEVEPAEMLRIIDNRALIPQDL